MNITNTTNTTKKSKIKEFIAFGTSVVIILFGAGLYIRHASHNAESASANSTAAGDSDFPAGYAESEEEGDISEVTVLSIVKQPTDLTVPEKSDLTIRIRAAGVGLKYQWYYKKADQGEFSEWIGRTGSTETVTPNDTWDGIQLRCVVSDEFGDSLTSDTATITIDRRTRVLAVGDSICRGYRNGEKGFIGDLDLCCLNLSVSGSTLSTVRNEVTPIPEQLIHAENFDPAIVIADGGYNDYCFNAPMGEIPSVPADSLDGLASDTVMGGLQRLFVTMNAKYPDARKFFVITHKVFKEGNYLVTTRNDEGYTQQDLHDALVECCEVYGIGIIDVFGNSPLDTLYDEYRSSVNYTWQTDPDWANARQNITDYVDADGIHPLTRGYQEYYLPLVREALLGG